MGKGSRKRVAKHPGLQPREQVIDACWGMGRGMLRTADIAGKMLLSKQISKKPKYAEELDAGNDDRRDGVADRAQRNVRAHGSPAAVDGSEDGSRQAEGDQLRVLAR